MREAFICDGIRTPIGRYGGALSGVRADDLAAIPLREAGHYQVFGLMIWLLSLCGNCWCETRVSMRSVSMM